MPAADFAPNYTPRIFMNYQTVGVQHTAIYRVPRGTGVGSLEPYFDKIDVFLGSLADFRFTDWQIVSVDFQEEDTDFSFPISHTITPAGGTVTVPTPVDFTHISQSFSFPGRSSGGHRAIQYLISMSLAAFTLAARANARITSAEHTAISNAIVALNSAPGFVGNDNLPVTFKNYMNLKVNSHWNKAVRT